MPKRKETLAEQEVYHVYNRSISEFKIFRSIKDYEKMMAAICYYSYENPPCKLSLFTKTKEVARLESKLDKIVNIVAYCIMPTHFHLILQPLQVNSLSEYINFIAKTYSIYFNSKYNRRGPLWEGRFKATHIKTDEVLLCMTRYVHLNPTTAYLIGDPLEWKYSSYKEYLNIEKNRICDYGGLLGIKSEKYKKFVCDHIGYQRDLKKIEHLLLD